GFLIHFFMSPRKNCKINGNILSWSFSVKNRRNGIKIIVNDTCTADVKIQLIHVLILLVISLMDTVVLSADSAVLSYTVSIESLAHGGQFSDLSIKSEVISIPSSINVGVFSIKLLTCFVIGGPTIAIAAHSNASRSRKIMTILLHLGNLNFSSNVCKGTVK